MDYDTALVQLMKLQDDLASMYAAAMLGERVEHFTLYIPTIALQQEGMVKILRQTGAKVFVQPVLAKPGIPLETWIRMTTCS